MTTVTPEEFMKQFRQHERALVVLHGKIPDQVPCYLTKYPTPLPDDAPASKLFTRLQNLLPVGTWNLLKADKMRIMNRRALLKGIRFKE